MRNEPPISTSCPLETITSFPSAKELRANRTAEALLFTITESSHSHSELNNDETCKFLSPLLPVLVFNSKLEYG